MNRRRFLESAAFAGTVSPFLVTGAFARQSASPDATPILEHDYGFGPTLAQRVEQVKPAALFDALQTTPVSTPLFPADTPPIEPVLWDDESDTDLAGTIGGVVFNTGYDENDNFLGVGVAIIHADRESAAAAMATTGPAPKSFLGMPWFVQAVEDHAASVIQIGHVLLAGSAAPPANPEESSGPLALRSITHMAALLDHLDTVLIDLGV